MAAPPVLRGSEPPPTRDVLPEPLTLPGMSPTTPTPLTVISRGRARRRDPATSPAPHPHHHRPKLFRLQLPIKRQLGGGYLFGLLVGFVADSISATIGATTAFLLGRTNIATQIKDRTLVESF